MLDNMRVGFQGAVFGYWARKGDRRVGVGRQADGWDADVLVEPTEII
jgi:hypothetical protein